MISRLAVSALLAAFAFGCSSTSASSVQGSTDGATGTGADGGGQPSLTGGGPPDCNGPCCGAPQAGSGCAAADQDASCATSVGCSGGLLLPFALVCDGTRWAAQGGDCGDSGIADNGCPTSQPGNGAPCTLPEGTWCQYSLVCSGSCNPGPDAGLDEGGDGAAQNAGDASSGSSQAATGCVSVSGKVGPAFCRSGHWETQSLGTCP